MSEAAEAQEDVADLTPETGAQEGHEQTAEHDATGDTDEAVELEALAMGWKPLSQFKGPKDKFVSAADYVERGKTIMPFLRKDLASAYKRIEGLEKAVANAVQHISKADQRAYARARAELDAELEQAAANGDAATVKAVTKDIVDLEKETISKADKPDEQAGSPEFEAWKGENDWYGTDKALSAAFDALCGEVYEDGYRTPKAGLKEAMSRLKEQFPAKFAKAENPNRKAPAAVEGAGTVTRRSGKTYADLPPEARQMCDEFVRDIKGFTREKYVKDYFQ